MIFVFLFLRARFFAVLIAALVTVFFPSPLLLFELLVLLEDELFFAAVFIRGEVASPSGAIQFVPSKL